jgi:hypothetical protein
MWRARTLAHEPRDNLRPAQSISHLLPSRSRHASCRFFQAKKFTGASERVTRKGNNVIAKCAINLVPPRIAETLTIRLLETLPIVPRKLGGVFYGDPSKWKSEGLKVGITLFFRRDLSPVAGAPLSRSIADSDVVQATLIHEADHRVLEK